MMQPIGEGECLAFMAFMGGTVFSTGYIWATYGWLWGLAIPGAFLGILLLLFLSASINR